MHGVTLGRSLNSVPWALAWHLGGRAAAQWPGDTFTLDPLSGQSLSGEEEGLGCTSQREGASPGHTVSVSCILYWGSVLGKVSRAEVTITLALHRVDLNIPLLEALSPAAPRGGLESGVFRKTLWPHLLPLVFIFFLQLLTPPPISSQGWLKFWSFVSTGDYRYALPHQVVYLVRGTKPKLCACWASTLHVYLCSLELIFMSPPPKF